MIGQQYSIFHNEREGTEEGNKFCLIVVVKTTKSLNDAWANRTIFFPDSTAVFLTLRRWKEEKYVGRRKLQREKQNAASQQQTVVFVVNYK